MRESFVTGEQYRFAGGGDAEDVLHALTKLAPDCSGCPGKRLYLCVEACCVGAQPFCLQCDSQLHFLHRKNELRMLFLDRRTIPTFSQNKRQLLHSLQQLVEERKRKVEGWVLENLQGILSDQQVIREKQERLRSSQASVDYGVKLIARCEQLLMSIRLSECRMTADWQQTMYELVERAVEGNRVSQTDKLQFEEALLNINLHEQNVEASIQEFCLLEAPSCWEQLPLVRVENVYWLNGDLADLLRQFEKKPNLETLVRETYIERFISRNDKQIYWHTTDSIHRARVLHNGYGSSRGSRLVLVASDDAQYNILLKNTVTQLYYDQERTGLIALPSRLKALTVSCRLDTLPDLPESLESLRLMITQPTADKKPTALVWSCALTDKLLHLRNLKWLTLNCSHLTSSEVKQVVRFARQKNLRMLVLLAIGIVLCEYTVRRAESIFSHVHSQLHQHYLAYKRRVQQIMLLHRTVLRHNSRVREDILGWANGDD